MEMLPPSQTHLYSKMHETYNFGKTLHVNVRPALVLNTPGMLCSARSLMSLVLLPFML